MKIRSEAFPIIAQFTRFAQEYITHENKFCRILLLKPHLDTILVFL